MSISNTGSVELVELPCLSFQHWNSKFRIPNNPAFKIAGSWSCILGSRSPGAAAVGRTCPYKRGSEQPEPRNSQAPSSILTYSKGCGTKAMRRSRRRASAPSGVPQPLRAGRCWAVRPRTARPLPAELSSCGARRRHERCPAPLLPPAGRARARPWRAERRRPKPRSLRAGAGPSSRQHGAGRRGAAGRGAGPGGGAALGLRREDRAAEGGRAGSDGAGRGEGPHPGEHLAVREEGGRGRDGGCRCGLRRGCAFSVCGQKSDSSGVRGCRARGPAWR